MQLKALQELLLKNERIISQIANEMSVSIPMPLHSQGNILVEHFFFARHLNPKSQTTLIYPPTWLAQQDLQTGGLRLLQPLEPGALGVPGTRYDPVGEISYVQMNQQAMRAGLGGAVDRRAELDRVMDVLLPQWAAARPADQEEARRFNRLFYSLIEAPLAPAYRKLGVEFLGWIGSPE